jgi:hypothetical protein
LSWNNSPDRSLQRPIRSPLAEQQHRPHPSSSPRSSATDLNLGITVWIGAQVERSGSVLLPTGLFTDLVAGLPNDRVTP